MQIIEKEIGRAVSPYFGELVCMADTEDNPCFWAIKKKMDFFNIKDSDLTIALNLYCYNRCFVSTYSDTGTESINKDVKDTYDSKGTRLHILDLEEKDERTVQEVLDDMQAESDGIAAAVTKLRELLGGIEV